VEGVIAPVKLLHNTCPRTQWKVPASVDAYSVFSERELTFTFGVSSRSLYAIARPSVVCLSVTFVRPTQAVHIFGNISMALGTLAIH